MTARIRQILTFALLLGIGGTFAELLLLGHDEDATQLIPLVLLTSAALALAWVWMRPGVPSVRLFQTVMTLIVVAGLVGMVLHFRANMEFQLEIDASLDRWTLFWKVLRAKAPPSLAPGSMVQMGLLGLALAYRHPAIHRHDALVR